MKLSLNPQLRPLELIETDISNMIDQANTLLEQLDTHQQNRYDQIASLSLQVNTLEAEIEQGAEMAHRLEQLQVVLRGEAHEPE